MTLTAPPGLATEQHPTLIRVLFADDSAAIRTLARYALSSARGFMVVGEAADGAEALRLYESARPDCVVLDIEMPGVGGFEALDELQRRAPGLPVVMLSGFSDIALTAKAASRGAAAYLEKSSQLGILGDTVRRVTAAGAGAQLPGECELEVSGEAVPTVTGSAEVADLRRLEYVISHDFAEPLRIVGGFASLLSNRYGSSLDASGRTFLEQIIDGTQRMQAMIDDLLVYSRAGRAEARLGPLDLQTIAIQARTELADLIEVRGAEVNIAQLPQAVGDSEMVLTVLVALVKNSLTFNRSTPPTVRIQGRLDGELAVVTVSDNGIGIDSSSTEEVFALFRRLNTREEYPGTGTGLALCRRLIGAMSGTIGLHSTPGVSTTVTLTLPTHHTPPGDRP